MEIIKLFVLLYWPAVGMINKENRPLQWRVSCIIPTMNSNRIKLDKMKNHNNEKQQILWLYILIDQACSNQSCFFYHATADDVGIVTIEEFVKINNYLHSPSIWFTVGGSLTAGSGTEITTFCKSNKSEASYSMLT